MNHKALRILVIGATGFIGERIASGLAAAGHEVLHGQRDSAGRKDAVHVDFTRDELPADWLTRLGGVDVVINVVGILRERGPQSFAAVHSRGPAALFLDCLRAGVGKVIQVSALGAEPDAASAYHRSKAQADALLATLPLRWVIVQPPWSSAPGARARRSFAGSQPCRSFRSPAMAVSGCSRSMSTTSCARSCVWPNGRTGMARGFRRSDRSRSR